MKKFLVTILREANVRMVKNRFSESERGFGQQTLKM
jgi:hypothetical protein